MARLPGIVHGVVAYFIDMEYCDLDLDQYIHRDKHVDSLMNYKMANNEGHLAFHICAILQQLLCGLEFIHSNRKVHRDLKPKNSKTYMLPTDQSQFYIRHGRVAGKSVTLVSHRTEKRMRRDRQQTGVEQAVIALQKSLLNRGGNTQIKRTYGPSGVFFSNSARVGDDSLTISPYSNCQQRVYPCYSTKDYPPGFVLWLRNGLMQCSRKTLRTVLRPSP